jgi:hypothetical protein
MVIYKQVIRLQFNSYDDTLGLAGGTYIRSDNNIINGY